jgi:DnaJ-class molecular chaperone
MTPQTYYEILGVDKTSTLNEIKRAYKKLASLHHPDKETGNTTLMSDINAAYACLSDPESRANYDLYGVDKVQQQEQTVKEKAKNIFMTLVKHLLETNFETCILKKLKEETQYNINKNKNREQQLKLEIVKLTAKLSKYTSNSSENIIQDINLNLISSKECELNILKENCLVYNAMFDIISTYSSTDKAEKQTYTNTNDLSTLINPTWFQGHGL